MKILNYILPLLLNKGEIFEYSRESINSLLKLKKDLDISFLKEQNIKSKLITIPLTSLDFSTNTNILPVRNYVKQNNIKIYHCLNNGFSLFPCNNLKKICTINTILPLSDPDVVDKFYIEKYQNKVESALDLSNKIIVPFYYMKTELINTFHINEEKISVIYPIVSELFKNVNSTSSKIYIRSKFKINFDYLIYIGEINPRNTLIETLNIFYILYMNDMNLRLILSITYLNKNKNFYLSLLSYIEQLNIQDNVIILTNITELDKIHLLNNALCFLYLNQYNELNLSILQCLSLNTKILCHPSEGNLESLENYPIYYTESMDLEDILLDDISFDDSDQEFILGKYNYIDNTEEIYEIYTSLL